MIDKGIKKRAIELRKKGYTLKETKQMIKNELDVTVSKASISNWSKSSSGKTTIKTTKHEVTSDKKKIKLNSNKMADSKYLLKKHGYDPDRWELLNAKHSEWDGQNKNDGVFKMYASKISVKPKLSLTDDKTLEKIKEYFENDMTFSEKSDFSNNSKYCLLEIRDIHLGLLSWMEEVGANYDHKIAEKLYLGCVDYYIEKMKEIDDIKQIVLVTGDDFFHFDTVYNTTTAGTRQDTDVRWQKMYVRGIALLEESIERLSKVGPVHVPWIGGNHDEQTSFHAYHTLKAYFKNDENITIDVSAGHRKYLKLGTTAVGIMHGKISKKNMTQVMPSEAAKLYSNCKFKEMHMGHFHTEETFEHGGVIYRRLPTLCGASSWEHKSGYISQTSNLMFIYDENLGLVDTMKFNPLMIDDKKLHKELNTEEEVSQITEL